VRSPNGENTGPLWARLLAATGDREFARGLDEAGLTLVVPLETSRLYQATPLNTATFAGAGSGVHFGFLTSGPGPPRTLDESPVVMTVPLAAEPNHVVGGSLREFLSLGCRQGWALLDQLAHDPRWATAWYQDAEVPTFPALRTLTELFGLEPWPDIAGRLAELREAYHDTLAIRADDP
jgi:hypothetical protein